MENLILQGETEAYVLENDVYRVALVGYLNSKGEPLAYGYGIVDKRTGKSIITGEPADGSTGPDA